MDDLQRITTEYVENEDRIRLAGEGSAGVTVVLWLTARLLNRLVPHLCAWLEQRFPGRADHAVMVQSGVIQSFAQQAALASLEQQCPVVSGGQDSTCLVHSVDVASGDQGVVLAFKAAEESCAIATLTLQDKTLRQWLNILHSQYQKGDWPLAVWPQWIAAPQTISESPHAVVLH